VFHRRLLGDTEFRYSSVAVPNTLNDEKSPADGMVLKEIFHRKRGTQVVFSACSRRDTP
jgi:hypothetical protein